MFTIQTCSYDLPTATTQAFLWVLTIKSGNRCAKTPRKQAGFVPGWLSKLIRDAEHFARKVRDHFLNPGEPWSRLLGGPLSAAGRSETRCGRGIGPGGGVRTGTARAGWRILALSGAPRPTPAPIRQCGLLPHFLIMPPDPSPEG
jgi:hypothetical protein